MDPSSISPYPLPGTVVDGKYRVERLLGEGGMGAVAKATHLVRRAPVALKFMSPAIMAFPSAIERFVNEGVAASQIDSDHVVKVFDVGRLPGGAPYLVMEFLDGLDLGQLLEKEGPAFPLPRAVHFALQILRALQTAHAAGIVHRDMKPSNCFVIEKDGERDFVKLVDFGISKLRTPDDASGASSANLTRTNSALGTPLYMSPEQARSPRDVDHRTDLYSVGAMLYEMLCGRTPYTAESGEYTEILFKIFTTEPESLRVVSPGLPDGIADVVHRALARDRNSRFGSAAEMAAALGPYADARSSQVLTRIHSARGRSLIPPAGSHTVTPMAPELRVPTSEAVSALTYSAASGSEALRAPPVPTDVGLTRESAGATPAGSRRGALFAIVGAVAVVGGTVGTVVALRPARPEPGHDPSAITASPPPSITAAAAPPLPAPPAPPAPPPAGTTAAPADKVILPPSGTGPASDASGAAPASSSTSSSSPPAVASPKPPPQEARTGGSSTNCLSCIIIR